MKKYVLLVLLASYSGLICSQAKTWDYEFVRDQSGSTLLALIPTADVYYQIYPLFAFVAVHIGEDWFFRTFGGWTKWEGNPKEISPVSYSSGRVLIASKFDPSKLPPFEIYASFGSSDLAQIIANGWYERVLQSEDLPSPPHECTPQAAFCHAFRSIVRVVKKLATNEYTPPETLALTATFDGVKFIGSDTGGCLYSGTLQPVVGPLRDAFIYTVTEPGMQVTGCKDPERNGWYQTFFVSYEQTIPSVFFVHVNTKPRKPFLLVGNSLLLSAE